MTCFRVAWLRDPEIVIDASRRVFNPTTYVGVSRNGRFAGLKPERELRVLGHHVGATSREGPANKQLLRTVGTAVGTG
jgi:hypothetical protein